MPSLEQAKAWYSVTDPVHGYDHIVRVFDLSQRIARLEGRRFTHCKRSSFVA